MCQCAAGGSRPLLKIRRSNGGDVFWMFAGDTPLENYSNIFFNLKMQVDASDDFPEFNSVILQVPCEFSRVYFFV